MSAPSPHAGHRRRVRGRILQGGIDGMAPHEVIEFCLFYAFPRQDVNPLAHRLIERFGGIDGVFSAPYQELVEVEGMTPRAAELIQRLSDVTQTYAASDPGASARIVNGYRDALGACEPYFTEPLRQQLCRLSLNDGGVLLGCEALTWDAFDAQRVRELMRVMLQGADQRIILVWKRLGRRRGLSPMETADLRRFLGLLSQVGIYLVDLIMTFGGSAVSLRREGMLRDEGDSKADAFMERWLRSLESMPDDRNG